MKGIKALISGRTSEKSSIITARSAVIFFISVLLIALTLSGCSENIGDGSSSNSENAVVSNNGFFLNTVISITLYDGSDSKLIDECFDLCRNYELIFSRTDPESELYKLNRFGEADVSDELLHVLNTSLEYCNLSNGSFDITMGEISDMYGFTSDNPACPSPEEIETALKNVGFRNIEIVGNHVKITNPGTVIDLGAVAKGYIADRIKEYLLSKGVTSAIINLGGNVLCIGSKPDGSDFCVGIQYPFGESSDIIATVSEKDLSVVTSGVYERYFYDGDVLYHHILNPETGLPYDNGILSVSIIAENSETCDALSTTAFALGIDKGLDLINGMDGVEAAYVTDEYHLVFSDGFEDKYLIEKFDKK